MIGEIRVVDDAAEAFSLLVRVEVRSELARRPSSDQRFRLGLSGGGSGERCAAALASLDDLPWPSVELFFVDERCVEATAPQSNQRAIRAALGPRVDEARAFYPMSCDEGPEAYETLVRRAGGFDVLQLGFGPDGHTASLFPNSAALDAPEDRLVVTNVDPSGNNPLERMTLTYAAINAAGLAAIVVTGAEKRDALARVVAGEDLPAARVRAKRVVWLCDHAAADGIIA